MPRGLVHQAVTTDGSVPSLHVTLSTAQQNAWADMLELVVPEAVTAAIQASTPLRESLPMDYLGEWLRSGEDR